MPAWASPRAFVSRSALEENLRAAHSARPEASVDVRMDAHGHGADLVTGIAASIGLAVVRDRPAGATLDPDLVFGFREGRPAMRFVGSVIGVKTLRAGEGVSYGYIHRAPADTRVALVSGGYAQGLVRMLGGIAEAVIGGVRHPIVGRVAMDACVVDVGDADVSRGDDAVFFGQPTLGDPPLAEWESLTRLTPGEITTLVGTRAARSVVA
ncbi:alanine racemase C-terminal domain-containing protein [Microbacterium sp. ASV49]|uniref:Alanine racemase C-terminal domain-containing protein n=1 Tax=Microbacterium candidum TaxID=3041922 RepID=A0ABT7MZ24_9MICO|nr:alanine racemase C-terminal domain-containing protein [Microbacterium sp. ASV49]MDL9979703.1 alanine racemase C-terminal domain-containing protein [Microbacterium sp. ASV49]